MNALSKAIRKLDGVVVPATTQALIPTAVPGLQRQYCSGHWFRSCLENPGNGMWLMHLFDHCGQRQMLQHSRASSVIYIGCEPDVLEDPLAIALAEHGCAGIIGVLPQCLAGSEGSSSGVDWSMKPAGMLGLTPVYLVPSDPLLFLCEVGSAQRGFQFVANPTWPESSFSDEEHHLRYLAALVAEIERIMGDHPNMVYGMPSLLAHAMCPGIFNAEGGDLDLSRFEPAQWLMRPDNEFSPLACVFRRKIESVPP